MNQKTEQRDNTQGKIILKHLSGEKNQGNIRKFHEKNETIKYYRM